MADHGPVPDTASPRGHGWQARAGVATLLVCAAAALFWPRSDGPRAAPAGMLVDVQGRPIPLATRTAPVTLVHLWATWCPPCLAEIPAIRRLAADFHGEDGFAVVMIAVQDDPEKVRTFLGSAIDEALFDPDWKITHGYGTRQLPETHLVVDGQVVHSFIGATDWDDPGVRDRVRAAIAAQRAGTAPAGG